MKSYNNKINRLLTTFAIVFLAAWASLTGCTTTADYTLGEELAPGHQQLNMRHRLYSNGMLKETKDNEMINTPCKVFEMRLYRTDSVNAASLDQLYLGLQKHDYYGVRKMGFASQMLFMSGVDDSIGFGYRPVYDSMMFLFEVDTFAGDTTKPIKYNVYALSDDLVNEESEDSIFIITYNPRTAGHLAADAEPIYTFEFPNAAKGVYTNSTQLRMQETPKTMEFLKKLICWELDENGLANKNTEFYQSDSAFVHNFPGLYIEAEAETPDGDGSAFAFKPTSTGISFYGRTRNPGADVDIMCDTLNMNYYFRDNNVIDYGNVSAQSVTFDYSGSEFASTPMYETEENRPEVGIGYVDGCGGMVTELTFTEEFLFSLYELVCDQEGNQDYSSAAMNQAALRIYLEDAVYDYTALDPISWAEKLNQSIPRLGLYINYKNRTPIPDYLYSVEDSGGTLAYNGYLNRSHAYYEMDITSYVQELVNDMIEIQPKSSEDIKEAYKKDKEEQTNKYFSHKFFIGPAANKIFTFDRSAVQGADVSMPDITKAAMELEITYTLIK